MVHWDIFGVGNLILKGYTCSDMGYAAAEVDYLRFKLCKTQAAESSFKNLWGWRFVHFFYITALNPNTTLIKILWGKNMWIE